MPGLVTSSVYGSAPTKAVPAASAASSSAPSARLTSAAASRVTPWSPSTITRIRRATSGGHDDHVLQVETLDAPDDRSREIPQDLLVS